MRWRCLFRRASTRRTRSKKLKSFYEYHSIFMAPWDGPAAVIFSDGRYAGGMLPTATARARPVISSRATG
ncbi:MAG: hypothetical protein ACLVK4_14315 [Alistipes shahii]|uniref:hypothetical protein n=1 Tax=Alistipes shahii TaxID=328814 RepID=UPI00399CDDA6